MVLDNVGGWEDVGDVVDGVAKTNADVVADGVGAGEAVVARDGGETLGDRLDNRETFAVGESPLDQAGVGGCGDDLVGGDDDGVFAEVGIR